MNKRSFDELMPFCMNMRGKSVKNPAKKKRDNAPSGLPEMPGNADKTGEAYEDEGLRDPGFINGVTGTGNGPEFT